MCTCNRCQLTTMVFKRTQRTHSLREAITHLQGLIAFTESESRGAFLQRQIDTLTAELASYSHSNEGANNKYTT